MQWGAVIAALLMVPMVSFAGVVRLAWDYDRTDHNGFRIYYGKTSQIEVPRAPNPAPDPAPYDAVIDILDPNARTYEVALPEGSYYFRMVAIGVNMDSDFTTEEPMGVVGINVPENFRIEWILVMPESSRGSRALD